MTVQLVVGRCFHQASQIHITFCSVIQLLVYDVHVEVKVEKWLLTPNIHTWTISCLSISTQTILKAKWWTQTSGQPGRCKWCISVMLPPTGQISIELHEFVDGEAIWCSDLEGAGPGPSFWMCDKASKIFNILCIIGIGRLCLWIFVLCEELLLDKVVDAAQGMASEIAYTRLVWKEPSLLMNKS